MNSGYFFGRVRFYDGGGSKIRQAFFWIGADMLWGLSRAEVVTRQKLRCILDCI
jgi:hypothetical protein